VFMTGKLNEDNRTELVVRSGKCEAAVDCVRGIVVLKLTIQAGSIARPLCDGATCS